jgi:hypothetical protein
MRILGVVSSSSREVPNAPTIGTATDIGTARAYNNGAATVTFTAPAWTGGLPITGYTVTSNPGSYTGTGASSPITVAGLQSATAYTFTARATNAVGQSSASAASNSITATTVPQAPTIGTATDGGTGSTVSVAFTAGATGGKTVTTYTATSSPGGLTGTSASSPITVSGLTAGTAYTFTVTATNANGTSTASAASNSVTPAVPSSYESISSVVVSTAQSTITFSSIPSTYKHLQVRALSRTNNGGFTSPAAIQMRLNGDSGANYSQHSIQGNGSTASAQNNQANTTGMWMGESSSDTSSSGIFGTSIIDIIDYASTSKNKTCRCFAGADHNSTNPSGRISLQSGNWRSLSAVNSLTFTLLAGALFAPGTIFALYGIKG